MPELPEVESVRRSLLPHVVGRVVIEVHLRRRDILIAPGDPAGGWSRQRAGVRSRRRPKTNDADLLVGFVLYDIQRRGKQLAILGRAAGPTATNPERVLIVQLGMTGSLEVPRSKTAAEDKHAHAVWRLDDRAANTMVFRDPRRFGGLRALRSLAELDAHWAALGPDALTISAADLAAGLRGSKRPIKAALLDQGVLAGVGNIYADESLFLACVHPKRRAGLLSADDCDRLAAAIRSVLGQAVDAGGSTLRDYKNANGEAGSFQTQHLVYGRSGCPCSICGTQLASATIAQRTTVWCPSCQPARPKRRA